ncbi:MAG: hypothetical protein GX137_00675 [Thermoplasmatales archaeon]|jgi:hypothetical protein|nr:hypothetical protein [Thermoplasmatales archaeon]
MKLFRGGRTVFLVQDNRPKMDILSKYDKLLMFIFTLSVIVCFVTSVLLLSFTDFGFIDVAPLISAPLLIVGLLVYLNTSKRFLLLIIAAVLILLYVIFDVSFTILLIIGFILVGSVGVAAIVSVLQKRMFYSIVASVEYMNVKERLSIKDQIVSFMFNIPHDMDSRSLTMDYNMKRASFPWNEVAETIYMGLMVGTFLWIYMSMNPSFRSVTGISAEHLYAFLLLLYMPIVVMPWSIFRSLKVRIETRYRDFMLYDGVKDTLKRMVVPILATVAFIALAASTTGIKSVLLFIVLSIVVNVVIIVLTSAVYYKFFESKIVDDIVSKWRVFRPVSLLMKVDDEAAGMRQELPGTPKRDRNDYGKLEFID